MGGNNQKENLKSFDELMQMESNDLFFYYGQWQPELLELLDDGELTAIQSKIFEGLYEDDPKDFPVAVQDLESLRRHSWRSNHAAILNCVCEYVGNFSVMPSVVDISAKTKLSRVTVTKHLKHFEKDEYLKMHLQKWKLVTEKVLLKLSDLALGNCEVKEQIKAAGVYLKFADKFHNPINSAGQKPNQNFIQINNIYITQESIQSLSEDKRKEIEAIILQNNEIPVRALKLAK